MRNLSSGCKFTKLADYASANTTDVTSASVDMLGYEGVVFLTSYGTAAANNLMHAEQSSDDGSLDGFSDIEGTSVGVSTSDEDQWLEIHRPGKRYLRVVCARGTSTTLENIWAIQYGARSQPVDNTVAGTIHGELSVTPAEGTA